MAGVALSPSVFGFVAPQPPLWIQTPQLRGAASGADQIAPCHSNHVASTEECNSAIKCCDLSIIDVEKLLKDKVRTASHKFLQDFQFYDPKKRYSVTKDQFRMVLAKNGLPLTEQQTETLLNKVDKNFDQTIRYSDFLDKFQGQDGENTRPDSRRSQNSLLSASEVKTDLLEKMLADKIQSNLKNVLRSLQLHDYNRDGLIQRQDLRKVIDSHCFLMSDKQFDKIYKKYDFLHKGSLNYKEFLQRLGVAIEKTPSRRTSAVIRNHIYTQTSQHNSAESVWGLDNNAMFHLEADFRKKMRDNLANVKRMFLVFDKSLDGFVSIQDLRSVLNNFTFPMSDQVFGDLMERLGIKASGKVSWEAFLRKFQNPLANRNGQTIPIRPAHRFFPVRGSCEKLKMNEIVKLLVEHIKNNHHSLRSAFLELDKNSDGKISRSEFRRLMDGFAFQLTNEQFKDLMIVLDPQHSNFVDYQTFLDLFEERESIKSHKWLNSCHRYNDHISARLSWSTLELSIRDKTEASYKEILSELRSHDHSEPGKVSLNILRKILEKYSIPVSNAHFQSMVQRFAGTNNEETLVSYRDFFSKLGTDLDPTDTKGISNEVIESNKIAVENHKQEQEQKMNLMVSKVMDRTSMFSVDEIIAMLKDKLNQHSSDLRQAFQYYARQNRNKITKQGFRKILEYFGFFISDDDFRQLCSHLSFLNDHMTYTNFLLSFEDSRPNGPSKELVKQPNHKVNKIRGENFNFSAEEIESRLRKKLIENFEDLHEAFYKFDDNHDGFLTKRNFRTMLQNFMLIMNNDAFEKFCERTGIKGSTRISYEDFLEAFQEHETSDGHSWLKSVHRYNQTRPTELWTAEEAHDALVQKAHAQWHDVSKAFRALDPKSKGKITRAAMREQLSNFMIPLDQTEFDILWSMYDISGNGYVSYDDFRKCLMTEKFAFSDREGLSHKIIQQSKAERADRVEDLHQRMEKDLRHQAERVEKMEAEELMQLIKTELCNRYNDYQTAFKSLDTKQRGSLSSSDIQNMLLKMNLVIDDDQLYDILDRLGLTIPKSRLSYQQFLKVFEDGRKDSYQQTVDDDTIGYVQTNFAHLSPNEAESKLRRKITEQYDVLMNACRSLDQQLTGRIPVLDLRSILDNFCFKLTDIQFKEFFKSVNTMGANDTTVEYENFLAMAKDPTAVTTFKAADQMSTEELLDHVARQVKGCRPLIIRALQEVDFAQLGVVSKQDFYVIFKRLLLKLNPEQFDSVWSNLPVNEFGNLDYVMFLNQQSAEDDCAGIIRPKTSYVSGRPSPAFSENRPQTVLSRCRSRSMSSRMSSSLDLSQRRLFTPLVNAEDVEAKLCSIVWKHWKDMQKYCRNLDPDNTGEISQTDFRNLIQKYNLNLKENEIVKILLKYDLGSCHTFSYSEFLRHFVLKSRHHNPTNYDRYFLDSRQSNLETAEIEANSLQKLLTPKPPAMPAGGTQTWRDGPSTLAADAKQRIHLCLRNNFKEMRNRLRSLDPTSGGFITRIEFHQLLHNYKIDLTEDEFCDLVESLDPKSSGQVAYNDFFRSYLAKA